MFTKCDLKTLELLDGNTFLGIVKSNENAIPKIFLRPFLRENSPKQIVRVGKRNYMLSDQFISASLNDYYKRINNTKEVERNIMLENYNRLYQSWTLLNQAKSAQNYRLMENYYDSLFYQLYLLGYKMSNN